ncbi:MAG TPA: KTSC domain-containing protein [Methanosarcinales archaeon]|nr:KTSC domain-containing protein [Methanosarcinales archaeon]
MTRQKVESSFIKSVGYDETSKILEIAFKGRPMPITQYNGVTRAKFKNFTEASSKGTYFNSKIKGQYDENKVR